MLTENQPDPGSARNCENCAFASEVRDQSNPLLKHKICRRMPPTPVLVPGPQGFNLMPLFPPVNASTLCGEHRLTVEIANAKIGPTEGPGH